MEFIIEKAPHLRRRSSATRMMACVLLALLPCVIFSFVVYGLQALKVVGICVLTMVIAEVVFVGLRNMGPYDGVKRTFSEKLKKSYAKFSITNIVSPLVSAVIFAMIMPASASWYQILISALFGIIVGKLLFGGLGQNIFNPAAVGRVFAMLCFNATWTYSGNNFFDVVAGGTPLTQLDTSLLNTGNYSLYNLFMGFYPGTIGETSALCILLGLVILLVTRVADFRTMLSVFLTFILLILFAGLALNAPNLMQYILYHVLSGGFLFGLTFMITDPVTTPITKPGRVIYGVLFSCVTILIRLFGAYPEGVAYAILIGNVFVPVIDYYKWSTNKYNYKHLIVVVLLVGIVTTFIFAAL